MGIKGNEDLKAKIAKLRKSPTAPMSAPPSPEPKEEPEVLEDPVDDDEESLEDLEAEFEERKKAIAEKHKASAPPANNNAMEQGMTFAELSSHFKDEGNFRTEIILQISNLGKTLKSIDEKLGALLGNGE